MYLNYKIYSKSLSSRKRAVKRQSFPVISISLQEIKSGFETSVMIKKIVTLQNEVEALKIKDMLDSCSIPHLITSFHDSAYDGLWQNQWGWGALEADEADEDKILALLQDIHFEGNLEETKE